MKKEYPVTIKDIAARLGVPPSTVGNVIRGDLRYSKKIRERVMHAVDKYGYRRNVMASALRGAKTNTVGVLWSFGGFDTGEIISKLTQNCFSKGYTTMISESMMDIGLINEKLSDFRSRGVDAVVLQWWSASKLPDEIIERLLSFDSLVVVSFKPVEFPCNNIVISVENAINAMVDSMVLAGSCRPAILISANANWHKINAWKERFLDHGIEISKDFLIDLRSGKDAMKCYRYIEVLNERFPDGKFPFDSLFCGVDEAALAAIQWLQKNGYRISEDVKVSGFNNSEFSSMFTPSISSIGRSTTKLVTEIINLLFRGIEKQEDAFKKVFLNYDFFERETIK